jgi:hypothetical protein
MSNCNEVLRLKDEVDIIAANVRTEFASLSRQQLNWKPSAERWSVAQCLDHLISANKPYLPLLRSIVEGKKQTALMERVPLLPGLWGRLLINAVNPKTTRKSKAPAVFRPASSDLPSSVVDDFVEQQTEFAGWMDKTKDLDLDHVIITSPALKLITYSVMDGYRFVVLHEQRHFQQAQRVMAETNFPK